MSDKNLTTFLTEWGGQVKELIEPRVKLEPEFYLGSKANPISRIADTSDVHNNTSYSFEYIGDGALTIAVSDNNPHFLYGFCLLSSFDGYNTSTSDITTTIFSNFSDYVIIFCPTSPFGEVVFKNGVVTITSAETNNYKAGKWEFDCYLDMYG